MFFSEDFLGSRGSRILAVCAAAFVVFALALSRDPPRQDLMDGTYTNPDCPGFEVREGTIRFGNARLPGKVERDKGGLYLLPQKALRYDIGPNGCRLLYDGGGFKHRALPEKQSEVVTGIEIYSADLKHAMVWTRASQPEQVGLAAGVK